MEVVLYVIIGAIILIALICFCGFSAAGVVAGSLAAFIQSVCYGGFIASCSIFSFLQSVGALGLSFLITPYGLIFLGVNIVIWIIYSLVMT